MESRIAAGACFFATGGVPPKKWELSVRVPEGFLVHTSGQEAKTSTQETES